MLVVGVGLYLEGQGTAVHFDAENLRAQADGGSELHPTISGSGALRLKHDTVLGPAILKVCADGPHMDVTNCKRGPVGGNVRGDGDLMSFRSSLQTEKAAQNWTHHHGRRPDLMRRTGGE